MTFTTTRVPRFPALAESSFNASPMSSEDRVGPGAGNKNHFLFSPDNESGHVPNDVGERGDDSQRNGTMTAYQRWRDHATHRVDCQALQGISVNAQEEFAGLLRAPAPTLTCLLQTLWSGR